MFEGNGRKGEKTRKENGAQSRAEGSEPKDRVWHSIFKAFSKVQGQKPRVKVINVTLKQARPVQARTAADTLGSESIGGDTRPCRKWGLSSLQLLCHLWATSACKTGNQDITSFPSAVALRVEKQEDCWPCALGAGSASSGEGT